MHITHKCKNFWSRILFLCVFCSISLDPAELSQHFYFKMETHCYIFSYLHCKYRVYVLQAIRRNHSELQVTATCWNTPYCYWEIVWCYGQENASVLRLLNLVTVHERSKRITLVRWIRKVVVCPPYPVCAFIHYMEVATATYLLIQWHVCNQFQTLARIPV